MKMKVLWMIATLGCMLFFSPSASAQTINGNIVGTVTDQQGAAVAGATVTVTNTGTGEKRDAITNDEGLYKILSLAVGTYEVTVAKAGFGANPIRTTVSAGADSAINIELTPGAVTASVTVTDTSGATLETTQSQVLKVVEQQRILGLPGYWDRCGG